MAFVRVRRQVERHGRADVAAPPLQPELRSPGVGSQAEVGGGHTLTLCWLMRKTEERGSPDPEARAAMSGQM